MADPPILGPYSTALPTMTGGETMNGAFYGANGTLNPPVDMDLMAQQQAEALQARKDGIKRTQAPMARSLRDRRRPVEEGWLRNLDCWKARHRRQGFRGEWFNHYIPSGRRAIERFVTRCKKMLFASPDAFEVYPELEGDPELGRQAEAIKSYLLWRSWRMGLRSIISQVIRCLCLYQRGIVKEVLDLQDVPGQIWPSVRAVDPFSFYLWPETATNIRDARVLIEHTMMPYEEYALHAKRGACDPIDQTTLTRPDWPSYLIERLARAGLSAPSDVVSGGSGADLEPVALVAMTEHWVRVGVAWEQSWLVWNVPNAPAVVRVKDMPFAPYRMAVARQLPGEHYTNGMMDDIEPLNVVMNDQFNMTMESQATSAFAPTVVNPELISNASSFVFRPRAKWLGDPAGVKALEIPNTAGVGFQGIQLTAGMIDSYSGSTPLAEGTPQRGMPRAGFAISSLIGLAMSDIQDMAELIEDEILTPMLSDLHRMTIMDIPPEQLVSVPGAEGVTAWRGSVGQLFAAASFRWVGTLQAQDMQVRAQRMMTLIGQLSKIYQPMLQQGYGINFPLLGKRVWRDGMGERGAETIFVALSQLQQQLAAMGATPPQQPGAGPTGGAQAPAPASAEQGQRQDSRQMAEGGVGSMMAGMGAG